MNRGFPRVDLEAHPTEEGPSRRGSPIFAGTRAQPKPLAVETRHGSTITVARRRPRGRRLLRGDDKGASMVGFSDVNKSSHGVERVPTRSPTHGAVGGGGPPPRQFVKIQERQERFHYLYVGGVLLLRLLFCQRSWQSWRSWLFSRPRLRLLGWFGRRRRTAGWWLNSMWSRAFVEFSDTPLQERPQRSVIVRCSQIYIQNDR